MQLLWKLRAALERTSHEMETRIGVSGPQRFLLRFVGLTPGVTREGLAELLAVDAADLQSDLAHLLSANLLAEQRGSPGYYLTAKGAGINAVITRTVEEAVSKASEEASPYERTSFRRMLERVVAHLGSPRPGRD
jgi:hypothetical protein